MICQFAARTEVSARVWCRLLWLTCLAMFTGLANAAPSYQDGISLIHELKYPSGFTHFDWVNPSAPKGGSLLLATKRPIRNFSGAWNTSVQSADGIHKTADRLFIKSADEPAAVYGLLADGVALSSDRKSLYVRLHEAARWHDGQPLTTVDIQYSFDVLDKTALHISYAVRAAIASLEILNPREFVLHHRNQFKQDDINFLTTVQIRPAHYYSDRDPSKATLEPPIGSGPYRVADFDHGYVKYERVADYWGRDLPVNRGRHNFDTIRYDVYRDATVARQAVKKGLFDVFVEGDNMHWHESYHDLQELGLARDTHRSESNIGPRWVLAFNLNREKFRDVRVREALALMFDFEWQNRVFHYGSQRRATGYFVGSPYSAATLPSPEELTILQPYRDRLDERVLNDIFELPVAEGRGVNRMALERAHKLLFDAGWRLDEGRWKDALGRPLVVEVATENGWAKRLLLPYVDALVRLGIDAHLRFLDNVAAVSYRRNRKFDLYLKNYDMPNPPFSLLPLAFSSTAAEANNGGNLNAISEPVVDDLIARALKAPNLTEATPVLKSLDRVLSWGFYDILLNVPDEERFVYKEKFGRPSNGQANFVFFVDGFVTSIDSWWVLQGQGTE